MKRPTRLTAERIAELAFELAQMTSHRTAGHAEIQIEELESALSWHDWSCRPWQVARRIALALFTDRYGECKALIAEQKSMLAVAVDEGTVDDAAVLHALITLSSVLVHYELGRHATPKERLAYAAADIPSVRERFAGLVRRGELESSAEGLRLPLAKRRRVGAYGAFALLAAWPSLLFTMMAIGGVLRWEELIAYLAGAVVMSAWLTKGFFTELRADERTVRHLSDQLKPRPVTGQPPIE